MTSISSSHQLLLPFLFFLFVLSLMIESSTGDTGKKKESVYVVYMGAANSHRDAIKENHIQLLASVLDRKEPNQQHKLKQIAKTIIVQTYKNGFSGFAAKLSKKEADRIVRKEGVVSVFEDPLYKLHTTRSWDFLHNQIDLQTENYPSRNANLSMHPITSSTTGVSETIIGLLDTGIWPESESFKEDKDMGPIPSKWKGVCSQTDDFSASSCNRKLIGARYYGDEVKTPRDSQGHGTHTASTAAGNPVPDASYYSLAQGIAKGGSPGSRIAVYRVCSSDGCRGSAILAAFDDAIADGVDVLSLSLGASAFMRPDFSSDPVAIGAFHAVENGITVVCSAGNEGPSSETVVNAAPWILTVAASTIDRDFESDVVLGGGDASGNDKAIVVKGEGINFSKLQKSPIYPLVYAASAKSNSSSISESDARNCNLGSLVGSKIKGKIVLCEHSDESYSKREKMEGIKTLGGIGLILIDDLEKAVASTYGAFPMTIISSHQADDILAYINSTRNPVATILPTQSVINYKPAPAVAFFSSRGPSTQTSNLLKPDIAAPGVNILASWIGSGSSNGPEGQKPSQFNLLSGTSMSCPHVSGVAATIKSMNPSWSPSAIRSAIMTTATQANNDKAPLTTDSGSVASPYDFGAGEISPLGALQAGLVYETDTSDYLQFLCNYGYKASTIKLISSNLPNGFDCSKNSSKELISQLNYPSIAIAKFDGKESKIVTRTVTNVATDNQDGQITYTASVKAPQGFEVKVIPDKLTFSSKNAKVSYQVIFSSASPSAMKSDVFGSITWSNGKYKVQIPFVISSN